ESQINYFKYKRTPGKENLTVFNILNSFRTTKFKEVIERGRGYYRAGDFESYDLLKGQLIGVTISGTFSPTRRVENLVNYTGYIILDIDKCGDALFLYKSSLIEDKFVHAAWISPSGDGLKFLIKTTNDVKCH